MTPRKARRKAPTAFVGDRVVELQTITPSGVEHPEGGPKVGKVTIVTYPGTTYDGRPMRFEGMGGPWRHTLGDDDAGEPEGDNPLGLPTHWTPELVKAWLGEAILTLMRLPAKGMRPAEIRSAWPEWLRDPDLAYGSDAVAGAQKAESNRRRPTILEIGRLDIALRWPFWIPDVRRRNAAVTLAMGFGLRKCADIVGVSHETVRVWADGVYAEIAKMLNEGNLTKSA